MKLLLGENLKKLRKQKDLTQEELAERLETTCASVSRWEKGICYPDMELLPSIANFFEVTVDELLGMREIRSQEQISRNISAAHRHTEHGEWRAAAELLRDGLRIYPNNEGLASELSLILSKTGERDDRITAIEISERLLAESANEKIRNTVRANLCFLYHADGQIEKAVAYGKTLPHIWECREVLMPDLVYTEQREKAVERLHKIASLVFRDVESKTAIPFSLGYTI